MRSLKLRLLVGIVSGVAAALALGIVVVFFVTQARLYAELDRNLLARTSSLTAMIGEEADVLELDWVEYDSLPPGFQAGLDYFRVEDHQTKEILDHSTELNGWDLLVIPDAGKAPILSEVILPGYRSGRSATVVFNARIDTDHDEQAEIVSPLNASTEARVGREIRLFIATVDTIAPMMARTKHFLVGLGIACIILSALIAWIVIDRNLRPLDSLRAQIEKLDENGSQQRIEVPRIPEELKPVTAELNLLLERVEKTLSRERTLTSNVAHELRTPIAGILSILEVTLSRLRSPEEYKESTQECFEIAKRMHWLVMNLLSVARIESSNVALQKSRVDLEHSLREWWLPFAQSAAARNLSVKWELESPAILQTDPEFLRVVVTNLYDNATSYTPEGETIHVVVDTRGNISIANKALKLNPEFPEKVFDTFWRSSEAREDQENHAGLGLSLCKKIVELLGGKISAVVNETEAMFVVNIELAGT